jgi:hypothetical protein
MGKPQIEALNTLGQEFDNKKIIVSQIVFSSLPHVTED